jgi:hypothetical protein
MSIFFFRVEVFTMQDKDFGEMMAALKKMKIVNNQKELAQEIGHVASVVSEMRKKNRFPLDWARVFADRIDLENIKDYDPDTARPAPPKIKDYKFFNDAPACKEIYGSNSDLYAHQFPDAMAIKRDFLKKKQLGEDNIFLFKDEKGTNTPDIMAQDVLVISRSRHFCGASYYLFMEYNNLYIRYVEAKSEKEYALSEKGTGFESIVDGGYLEEHVVGRVVLKLTDNIRTHR